MVARLVRDQEVVGSSPVTSTTKGRKDFPFLPFVFVRYVLNPRPLKKTQGSRKSQRSEIFGKRSDRAINPRNALLRFARKRAREATRVQVPSPRPQKSGRQKPSALLFLRDLPLLSAYKPQKERSSFEDSLSFFAFKRAILPLLTRNF